MVDFLPKIRVEVVLPDDRVEQAIEAVVKAARTGKIGDGKIFVLRSSRPSASAPAKPTKKRSDAFLSSGSGRAAHRVARPLFSGLPG